MAGPAASSKTITAKIGGTFERAAQGPVGYAAGLITGNKIQTALAELAPDGLIEAYERGVGDVAKMVGVSRTDVETGLPINEMKAIAIRLRASQPPALAAWKMHAGQFGFLDVITQLTVDGRHPDIKSCLERVAGKVRADRHLSDPLMRLAGDIADWEDLVIRSRAALEGKDWLIVALRKKRMKRIFLMVLPTMFLVFVTAAIVIIQVKRANIETRVAEAKSCLAYDVKESDIGLASDAQRQTLVDQRAVCDGERAAEAKKKADEEARRKVAAAAAAKVQAHEAECKTLADELRSGRLGDASKKVAGESADLLQRIADKKLVVGDIGPANPVLPCKDTKAHAAIAIAFDEALLVDTSLWARQGQPSDYVVEALLRVKDAIPALVVIGLADYAESTAKSGLVGGSAEVLAKARRLCTTARKLGVPGRAACTAAEK